MCWLIIKGILLLCLFVEVRSSNGDDYGKMTCKVQKPKSRMPKALIIGGGGVPIKTATATVSAS